MATWLSEYKNLKNEMEKQIGAGHASLEQLMLYQELLYRIEVLYASQAFCQTAPVTTDVAGRRLYPVPDQGTAAGTACRSESEGQAPDGVRDP